MNDKYETSYKICNTTLFTTVESSKPDHQTTNLDVVRVRQKHGKAVNSYAPPCRRRKSILQSCAEGFISRRRLVISSCPVLGLLLEPFSLGGRVIELSVRVAHFFLHHKEFESNRVEVTRLSVVTYFVAFCDSDTNSKYDLLVMG